MGKGIRETGSNTRPQTVQKECGRRNRAAEEREGKGGGSKSKERAERLEWRGEGSSQEARRGEERKKRRERGRRHRHTHTHTHTAKTKMSGCRKSGRKAAKALSCQKQLFAAGESSWSGFGRGGGGGNGSFQPQGWTRMGWRRFGHRPHQATNHPH